MEGVPRIPMSALELKSCPESVDFSAAIRSYITNFYHENADAYSKECSELEQLRQSATQVTIDFMGCSLLKKYYSQLHLLHSRFPMGSGEAIEITFKWDDAYTCQTTAVKDIKFEQACILYNIGALHSILGGMDNRTTPEGMKVSCTHFQCSAWAFQQLNDVYGSFGSSDMSHELLTFHSTLMLAQAQECILEKSMTDSRKSSITAKVAAQIVDYYKLAMRSLDASNPNSIIGSKKYKEWRRKLEVKTNFYQCIMYLYLGTQSEEQQKWGERLTYFQAALDRLNEALKLNKSEDSATDESLRFTLDVVGGKYNAAKKDNDFVYHDKVPALDTLPEIKGAPLVKGIPFNPNDPEVSGPDIFKKLVPMEAHKASSLYSEEKAKLLRRVGADIEDKEKELVQFLLSLQLDTSLIFPEPQRLPEALLEKCAAISVKPEAIKDLIDAMQSLSGVSTDVEGNLKEIADLLEENEKKDKEMKEIYGTKRSTNVILDEIRKDLQKCSDGLQKASASNSELNKLMRLHVTNLRLLSGPLDELQKTLPSHPATYAPEDEATMQEMKRLMDKVDEMKNQRRHLEQQLREQVLKDDITSTLVTRDPKNFEEFFAEEIGKHGRLVGLLDQNMAAQANILRALTEANANYAKIRRDINDVNVRRDAMVRSIVQSYEVYEDLLAKTQKGVEFYGKLDSNVSRLLERTRSVCKIEQEEREKILERLAPKGPPPARPTAPKPGQALPALPQVPYGSIEMTGIPLPSAMGQFNLPSGGFSSGADIPSDAPKLKDFLPFMKPNSFGSKSALPASGDGPSVASAGNRGGALRMGQQPPAGMDPGRLLNDQQPGSLPSSHSASPVHLPHPSASHPSSPLTVIQGQQQPHIPQPLNPGSASRGSDFPGIGEGTRLSVAPESGAAPGAIFHAGFSGQRVVDGVPRRSDAFPPLPSGASSVLSPTAPPGAPGSSTQFAENSHRINANVVPFTGAHPGGPVEQFTKPPPPSGVSQQYYVPGSYVETSFNPKFSTESGVPVPGQSHLNYSTSATQPLSGPMQPGPNALLHAALLHAGHHPSVYGAGITASGVVSSHNYANSTQNVANGHSPRPAVSGQIPQPRVIVDPRAPGPAGPLSREPESWNPHASSTVHNYVGNSQAGYVPFGQGFPGQGPSGQTFFGQGPIAHNLTGQGLQNQNLVSRDMGQYHTDSGAAISYQMHPQPPGQPPLGPSSSCQGPVYLSSQPYLASGQKVAPVSNVGPVHLQQYTGGNFAAVPPMPEFQPTASGGSLHSDPRHPVQYSPGGNSLTTPGIAQPTKVSDGVYHPQLPGSSLPGGQQPPGANFVQQQPHVIDRSSYGMMQSNVGVVPTTQPPVVSLSNSYHQPSPGTAMIPQQPPQPRNAFYQQPPQSLPHSVARGNLCQQPHPPPSDALGANYLPLQATANSYNQPQVVGANLHLPQQQATSGSLHQPMTGVGQQVPGTGASMPLNAGFQPPNLLPPGTGRQVPAQSWSSQQIPVHPGTSQCLPAISGTSQHMPTQHGTSLPITRNIGSHQQAPVSGVIGNQPYPAMQPHAVGAIGVSAPMTQGGQAYAYQPTASAVPPSNPLQGQNNWGPSNSFQSPTQDMLSSLPSPLQPSRPPCMTADQAASLAAQQPPAVAPLSSVPSEGPAADEAVGSTVSTQGSAERRNSAASNTSSLDELLSASPKNQPLSAAAENVLIPKVITAEDRRREKEEEARKSLKQSTRDPYTDPDLLGKFVAEVEKFQKHVEALCKETLGKYIPLEKEWKELNDEQEKTAKGHSMAIARCYPLKNRYPDVMPFDSTRVKLTGASDDYINASHLNSTAVSCPEFIATQSPLPATFSDFWQMVHDQGSEIIVMLCAEAEPGTKNHCYWPQDKGQTIAHGAFQLTLQSIRTKPDWIERILTMSHKTTRQSRSVVHLQFLRWPPAGVPESPASLLLFITEVHNVYIQQRSLMKPVIVSCSNGIGRTGAFCVIYTGIQEINQGHGIINIPEAVTALRNQRKSMIQHKEQLKFCYDAVLYYAQDLLMKRGILTSKASFGDRLPQPGDKNHMRKPSEDFVFGHSNVTSLQSSLAKLSAYHVQPTTQPDSNAGSSSVQPPQAVEKEMESLPSVETEVEKPSPSDVNGKDVTAAESDTSQSLSSRPSSASAAAKTSPQSSAASSRSSTPSMGQLPPSLADLQNPSTFKMDVTQPTKKKITKASFLNPGRSLAEGSSNPADPLSQLDPLWSLKDKAAKK